MIIRLLTGIYRRGVGESNPQRHSSYDHSTVFGGLRRLAVIRTIATLVVLFSLLSTAATATPLMLDYTTQGTATFTPRDSAEYSFTYGLHQHNDPYQVNGGNWDVWLNPDPPEYLRGVSETFSGVMSSAFKTSDGWTYQSAARELSDDSLVVRVYAARSGDGTVGAELLVEYVPHGNDPLDVHWIQGVQSNHRQGAEHGTLEDTVDYRYAGAPYYDQGGVASSRYFYDFPQREWDQAHTWKAELYLVTGPPIVNQADGTVRPTPGAVTFLGGISWGWENACVGGGDVGNGAGGGTGGNNMVCAITQTPEPATLLFVMSGMLLLCAIRFGRPPFYGSY